MGACWIEGVRLLEAPLARGETARQREEGDATTRKGDRDGGSGLRASNHAAHAGLDAAARGAAVAPAAAARLRRRCPRRLLVLAGQANRRGCQAPAPSGSRSPRETPARLLPSLPTSLSDGDTTERRRVLAKTIDARSHHPIRAWQPIRNDEYIGKQHARITAVADCCRSEESAVHYALSGQVVGGLQRADQRRDLAGGLVELAHELEEGCDRRLDRLGPRDERELDRRSRRARSAGR